MQEQGPHARYVLAPEALHAPCDPAWLDFETTEALEPLEGLVGQERVAQALDLAVSVRHAGFNLYVMGRPGTGRHEFVRAFLERAAAEAPVPSDWCYVRNFDDPDRPRALELPPGRGAALRADLQRLVEEVRAALSAAFESEEYRRRVEELERSYHERPEHELEAIREEAHAKGLALLRTPEGFAFAPMRDGEVMDPKAYEALPEAERKRIEAEVERLQERMQSVVRQMPAWHREMHRRLRELERETARMVVGHLVGEVRERYADLPAVAAHLDAVGRDMVDNAARLVRPPAEEGAGPSQELEHRYGVNLIVDRRGARGAPVVYADHPTWQNLLGRVEYMARYGALVTDFTLIRAGALHQANGGYLILDAHKVLAQPFAWEGLKRALQGRALRIESPGQTFALVSTVSLEPEPIPLRCRVVLVGDRLLYYLLQLYDPEFGELFRVPADFSDAVRRDREHTRLYARLLATVARREGLRPFAREAVARLLDEAARLAEHAGRLSAQTRPLAELMCEADLLAARAGRAVVEAADVRAAIRRREFRMDRLRERVLEEIGEGTILIDTEGARVGQVNGLSVIELGDFAFGRPARITATVRLGEGEVVDIEREVELGGPIHSKAVLILSRFLSARYAREHPLSLSASVVFEQSYDLVEGDSASVAELCALLSALAEVPVRQDLAVTGSVNQHGEVQAVGGVNQKVEGFFDACRLRGLKGQGVVLPRANVRHLMLREDVVAAVRAGEFHVYAVSTVDEALELLTGLPAGERDAEGRFPEGSLNRLVEDRLVALAELRHAWQERRHDGTRSEAEDEHGGGSEAG